MPKKTLTVLLGNQLFSNTEILTLNPTTIFMAEDFELCTYEKHHKLKLLMFLGAMREKRDELTSSGFDVHYQDLEHTDFKRPFEYKLKKIITIKSITAIKMFEIEDKEFEKRIIKFAKKERIDLEFSPSPMFLLNRTQLYDYITKSKKPQMGNFYKIVRTHYNLLMDEEFKPLGGKWSFDEDNRKRIPKGLEIPKQYQPKESKYLKILKQQVETTFSEHPGKLNNPWTPLTRSEALKSLDNFLQKKFQKFGPYEDGISKSGNFLFHSGISPSLNMGLITPKDVIDKTLSVAKRIDIPLNSVEGFLRQIIGWREFIRGIYQIYSNTQLKSNFFNFTNSLKKSWYNGNTGIPPLDDAIKFSTKYGYTHHINRLMIISNIMTLCEVHPQSVYRWFMEMYVDSSEWVMTPNVFGMGTFADGGIFSTKPYICGSNYILKMSDYQKGPWCDTMDGLYWSFIAKNIEAVRKNGRMPFVENTLNRMDPCKKRHIFQCAKTFIEQNCTSNE